MVPGVFLANRNFAVLKQIQHVMKVKNSTPIRSISQLMCPATTSFSSQLSHCGCGSSVGTVSQISYSAARYSNKTVGIEYEDGKLIYFGAKAPLVKRIQMALYTIGAAITIPSPYLFDLVDQEFPVRLMKYRIVFTSKDCSMPDSPTAFASFLVKKTPLLVSSDNMDYFEYSKMLRYASDLDYENPDRQSQYEETLQDAIREIGSQKSKKQSSE